MNQISEICFEFYVPNWFEMLSLFTSLLAIGIAYWLGHKQEINDKKLREELIKDENNLFEIQLKQLKNNIVDEIKDLEDNKDIFRLKINQLIQIDFLNFIDVKSLYKINNRDKVNDIISSLYILYDFNPRFISEIKYFEEKYNRYKNIFRENYQKVFYTKYYETYIEGNNTDNPFLSEYVKIVNQFNNSNEEKIVELLNNITNISFEYIRDKKNKRACEINELANMAIQAYEEKKLLKHNYNEIITNHISILKNVKNGIEKYLN